MIDPKIKKSITAALDAFSAYSSFDATQLNNELNVVFASENDFMGKEGQTVPEMSKEWVRTISLRYIELFETITGAKFIPQQLSEEETVKRVSLALEKMK